MLASLPMRKQTDDHADGRDARLAALPGVGRGGYNQKFSPTVAPRLALGGRPTVGHVALDHGIGVRIPASQPSFGFVEIVSKSAKTRSKMFEVTFSSDISSPCVARSCLVDPPAR
jgi:hypothetical protein